MDKLKGAARRALAQIGLLQHVALPTTESPGRYSRVDGDDAAKDSERLLASSSSPSPSPSGESDLTACEKIRAAAAAASCDCDCHHHHHHQKGWCPPGGARRRLTAARIHLFASLFWLLGVLLIILAFRGDRSTTPANGTFGWCT